MSFFNKFKQGLTKTRNFVADSFNRIAANLGYFDEDMLDDLEMTLVQADCGMECSSFLLDEIRESIRQTGDKSVPAVLDVLSEAMLEVLGPDKQLPVVKGQLNIVLMVGVNGTGKTTTAGKLAKRYKDEGYKVLLAAADTFRAAAIEQLQTWGERSGVDVIAQATGSDPAAVVYDAIQAAKARGVDLLLVDTAGRLHNKQNLMEELAKIRRVCNKSTDKLETILVIDATTGQNALQQAKAFSEVTEVTGLAISKLDGNAKGGVALAVAKETNLPIYLAGLGEAIEDLQDFDRVSFVKSLLPDADSLPKAQ